MEDKAGISLAAGVFALAIGTLFPQIVSAGEQDIIQQQRQKAIEAQLQPPTPDIRLPAPASSSSRVSFPQENPCFEIQQITLNGLNDFPGWLPLQRLANQGLSQCLGVKGINLLMSVLQNRMIDSGYVTSRVLVTPQDLTRGTLTLQLLAGKISHITRTDPSDRYVTLATALPSREGQLYDLRDTEQGLENLQRLPTVQADIALIPGSAPGESVMAVQWNQSKMWRLGVSLDDSGSTSTGRYQGGLTLYVDNPLSLSDMLNVSASHDLQFGNDKGTKNFTGSYSMPFGYWLAGISTGGSIGNQFAGNMANGLLTGVNNSGSDSSTTHSAISEGSIFVRDQDKQQQDVASLSRDVENANPGLGQIFDKEKEQNRLKEAQLIGEIGSQVGDIARTQGQIEATKAGKAELTAKGVKEPGENATKEERAAWNKALTETSGYKKAQQQWGTGSAIQQSIQAATAAIQGLAGGNIAQAVSGAASPARVGKARKNTD